MAESLMKPRARERHAGDTSFSGTFTSPAPNATLRRHFRRGVRRPDAPDLRLDLSSMIERSRTCQHAGSGDRTEGWSSADVPGGWPRWGP
jgi:hypothetical protein